MKKRTIRNISCALLAGSALVCGELASAQVAVSETTTTTTAGTISEFSPNTIVVKTESAPAPIRYSYTKSTTYVDETGAPVSLEMVKSGLPVTVYYVKEGERMVASKVIVRKVVSTTGGAASTTTTTTAPVKSSTTVIEKKPAPVLEEKKSSTTTTTETK